MGKHWRRRGKGLSLETLALGGMTAPVTFRFPSGREFSPLSVAPWSGEALPPDVPPHLTELRGVFSCLPFGSSSRPRELSPDWATVVGPDIPDPQHGEAANGMWDRLGQAEAVPDDDSRPLRIGFRHDPFGAIVEETQTIGFDVMATGFEVTYSVEVRRALRLPFGFHVMIRWPEPPGGLRLLPGRFAFGLTYPGLVEPGTMATRPGLEFSNLDSVPAYRGGAVDLTRPDLREPLEDIVQLCGIDGCFEVHYPHDGAGLRIGWDSEVMPSCLLWFSRRGLTDTPWNGRYTAIGIEPIAAAFDLAPAASIADNPINRRGIATCVSLAPERRLETRLRIEAFEL